MTLRHWRFARVTSFKASPIYRSAFAYELIMLALYGRHYQARYKAITSLIPNNASVIELCCGPGILYDRFLRLKAVDYLGLDINHRFVRSLAQRGIRSEIWDLRDERPLPRADYVLMQASLYHFLPDPRPIVDRMLAAARKQVIIAEPIRNLASSDIAIVAYIARNLTDVGIGTSNNRFEENALDELAQSYREYFRRAFLAPGGREKIYVFDKSAEPQ